jgi:rhodanese-related sulfurtransferase
LTSHTALFATAAILSTFALSGQVGLAAQDRAAVRHAVTGDIGEVTPEISTDDLERVLATRSATVIDARPPAEFGIGHIPGAVNVAPRPGRPMAEYISDVAEIGRIVNGNRAAALVLYCNGMHCGKTNRLAAELRDAAYTNIRRYQLGMPVWRALGGIAQIELEAVTYVLAKDRTAVVVDVREAADFKAGSLPQAINIPRSLVTNTKDTGEVRKAKDDGRLPMNDHRTRIIVAGANSTTAAYVAQRLAFEAFDNVSFFGGSIGDVQKALEATR